MCYIYYIFLIFKLKCGWIKGLVRNILYQRFCFIFLVFVLMFIFFQVIFIVGYKVVFYIYFVVEECEIMIFIYQIDFKIKKFMKKKVLFVKSGVVVVVCIQVSIYFLFLFIISGVYSMDVFLRYYNYVF